jgi:hypothetical protein
MNTPHTLPSSAPRKELISGLQKVVVSLLFVLLLALAGSYLFMNTKLEQQNNQQEKVNVFVELVHNTEGHWLEWLLLEDRKLYTESSLSSASSLHQALTNEYQLIEHHLNDFDLLSDIDISESLVLLNSLSQKELDNSSLSNEERQSIYASFDVLENVSDVLLKVNLDVVYEQQAFVERLVWAPVAIFVFISIFVIAMTTDFARQLRSGFAGLHYILDHRKHGHALIIPPRKIVDELTDFSHLVDNELASRGVELNHKGERLALIESALSRVNEAFFVTNKEGDIAWLSAGAERLWFKNTALFESIFEFDEGLDDPVGERVVDSILQSDEELTLKLSDGVYCLNVNRLMFEDEMNTEMQCQGCIISLEKKSDLAELQVLHNSLKLMAQDVWDMPIRLLKSGSPYASFAKSLEVVRRNVITLLSRVNAVSASTNSPEKITKLQQIASLIDEKNNHNEFVNNEVVVTTAPLEGVQVELNDMAWLSEQIRDSLILGYELVLQRLALVEKDLSSDVFLLVDVDRCLNEVRAGVLSSLAAVEGEGEIVRRRFAIDLEHDISKVQSQIEDMKSMATSTLSLLESDRSVGVARLDRARESVNEIVEKIHELMARTTSNVLDDNSESVKASEDWDGL